MNITDNNKGIILDIATYNNVSSNYLTNNSRGIDLIYSSNNEIFNNIVDKNDCGIGLKWGFFELWFFIL